MRFSFKNSKIRLMTKEQLEKAKELDAEIVRASNLLENLDKMLLKEDVYIEINSGYNSACLHGYLEKSDMDEILALTRYRVMNKIRALKSELDNL